MTFEECFARTENAGFKAAGTGNEAVKMAFCPREDYNYIVLLWNEAALPGINPDMIDSQDRNVRHFFAQKGVYNCRVLNIICTFNIGMSKRNLQACDPVWFVDLSSGKLIIYEGQPERFLNLKDNLEAEGRGEMPQVKHKVQGRTGTWVPAYINWIIILANIVVYILLELGGSTENSLYMLAKGALNVELVKGRGEYYRIFTSMFMHAGFSHLFNNMFVLWYIGDNLERAVGHVRYLIMYMAGGLLANLAALFCYDIMNVSVCCVGASGAIFSVVGALFYIVIANKGRLEDLTAVKLGIYIFLSIYLGIQSATTSNSAHIGGLVAGIILAMIIYRRRKGTVL